MTDSDVGLYAVNASNPKLRNCLLDDCDIGVIAVEFDMPDLGTQQDYGRNDFNGIKSYYAVNNNPSETLMMVGNCYDGKTRPKPKKFTGLSPIVYKPGYCDKDGGE